MKFQAKWPPVRRETLAELQEETSELDRALRATGGFNPKGKGLSGMSASRTSSSRGGRAVRPAANVLEELGGRSPLEREFRTEMGRAFTEQDAWEVFLKYVGRVQHGKAGYGGQSHEHAEQIVMKMWQDFLDEQGLDGLKEEL